MNRLPPLHLMKKWREDEGLNPEQVRAKAEAWFVEIGQPAPAVEAKAEVRVKPVTRRNGQAKDARPKKTPPPVRETGQAGIRPDEQPVMPAPARKSKATPAPVFSFPAPAGQGYRCDGFHPNPDPDPDAPRFLHCRQVAVYRLIVRDERRARNVKRCPGCAYDLRYMAGHGLGGIKIELDEPLGRRG